MAYTNIDDPSAYFTTTLYTGNGSANHAITNDANAGNFQPDMLWYKSRSYASSHILYDSSRGDANFLTVNTTSQEKSDATMLDSFDSNGFTLGSDTDGNRASNTFVAWQWKCNGGTTVSNTDGDLTSTVQFNSTAGFAMTTYTGKSPIEPLDVGHGMGEVPDMFIIKNRTGSRLWVMYHKELTSPAENRYLILDDNQYGELANSTVFRNEAPTTTVIKTGENAAVNQPNENFIVYAWKERQGYSKFGKYTGNGSANGTFVYTGFKPAFVLWRIISSSGDWRMVDTKRGVNGAIPRIKPNASSAEGSAGDNVDLLSNGFKFRSTAASANASGASYIYIAFAENPFTTSTGIPTTAR